MQEENKQPRLSWSMPSKQAPSASSGTAAPAKPAGTPPLAMPSAAGGKKILHTQMPVYAGILVGGIILGVLLATAWSSRDQGDTSGVATSTKAAATSSPAPAGPKASPTEAPLVVADQPAGASVSIAQLNIARPTWVVVYVSREGSPGNALGARLFFANDRQGKVGLLRNTVAGQSYFIGLSVDNGDRTFSLSKDLPLADAGGPLWATFRAL